MEQKFETAVFAGGCFWCIEAVFQRLEGVEKVISGYSGGRVENPTYEQVSSGSTGHAEVVKVEFDPTVVSYRTLLEAFFTVHDPTTLNRQGGDIGEQYRSAIFYTSDEQKKQAEKYIGELNNDTYEVVTQVRPFTDFYAAEDYHQNYYNNNTNQGYCSLVISPKIKKFQEKFARLLKPE